MDPEDACRDLGISPHTLKFTSTVFFTYSGTVSNAFNHIHDMIKSDLRDTDYKVLPDESNAQVFVSHSILIKVAQNEDEDCTKEIIVSWANRDENLGSYLVKMLQNMGK